ncbi:MAG: hypothetical protein IJA20_07345 [Methanocorpusculum sp.]|nr:hypothetical protein [Oscillospiraceae bacterium]MBQ3570471.1 hypothetical protein [Methanocorpusculum sp.]
MRDFIRKPGNWVGLCIALTFLFALLYSFISASNANLPSYVAPEQLPAEEDPKPVSIDTVEYTATEIPLNMQVPADWRQITKGGNTTFINPVDGASISFDIGAYVPGANMVTEAVANEDITRAGGSLVGFTAESNSSYMVVYELGSAVYLEYSTWNLTTFVRVTFQMPQERYDHYYDIAILLFDSFTWEKAQPIPDGFSLFYSAYGNFEFGVPDGWTAVIEDGAYIASAPSDSRLTVTVTPSEADLSALSQLDYIAAASQGKQDYLLSSYSNTGTSLAAEASYSMGGAAWYTSNQLLADNGYLYEVTFDCAMENYDADAGAFMTTLALFRVFD